ncbi:MAG: uroporphyrinogen decarboxylase [Bacteroidales bacterium]|nr:uroporphyrinogen decarboxylase [Bacteroidales bacterium]
MTLRQWNDLVRLIEGQDIGYRPSGFIIDSPWIPGWYGISNIRYYASADVWLKANLKACNLFPDVWFLPGFWSEFGMCTEPSAYGARMKWMEQSLPHAEKVIKNIEDISNLPVPDVKTDGLLPFMIDRLKDCEPAMNSEGHQIKFAISRGPLNIASFLMGTTEFMMSLAMNPAEAKVLVDNITDFVCNWLKYQKECFPSIEGILVLDDLMGFIGDYEFNEYAIPAFRRIFSSFDAKARFLHNDAQGLITAKYLCEMNINMFNFSFEHSMSEIRSLAGPGVVLVGNIPPRDVMAAGTPQQVKEAVKKAASEINDYSRILWSVGGGMPPGVRNENITAFTEAVNNEI